MKYTTLLSYDTPNVPGVSNVRLVAPARNRRTQVEPGVVRDCGDAHALLTDIPGTMSSNETAEVSAEREHLFLAVQQ